MSKRTMEQVLADKGRLVIVPKGNSMYPLLRDGKDTVEITRCMREPEALDILLYKNSSGHYILHRLLGKDCQGYILCGDGQSTREYGIQKEQIMGVVTALYRGKRKIRISSVWYRYYSIFWCGSLRRRKALLRLMNICKKRG